MLIRASCLENEKLDKQEQTTNTFLKEIYSSVKSKYCIKIEEIEEGTECCIIGYRDLTRSGIVEILIKNKVPKENIIEKKTEENIVD
jgi:DNA-binding IclR family transcriptional regulator